MADPEQLRILNRGAEVWNRWRKENYNLKIDLKGTNLSYVNLKGANLKGANLRGANLRGANLRGVNLYDIDLRGANLHGVDLSKKDLSGKDLSNTILSKANLTKTQALRTNFNGTIFTGACIQDWNINSETNLDNVICDYVYLKEGKQKRRPSDPNKNFGPGEFTKLFQQALETVDLIFSNGIDWQAFLIAFQKLQQEDSNWELAIQAIEKKSDSAFVIRVEVPPKSYKAEVEKYLKQEYEVQLHAIEEKYRLQLQEQEIETHKQNGANILKIAKLIAKASNPLQNTLSLKLVTESESLSQENESLSQESESLSQESESLSQENESLLESKSDSPQSKCDLNHALINNIVNIVDNAKSQGLQPAIRSKYTAGAKKTLAEAVAEKEKLQQQIKKTDFDTTETSNKIYVDKITYVNQTASSGNRKKKIDARLMKHCRDG